MDDRKISFSATCAVAYTGWVLAVSLMIVGVVLDRPDVRAIAIMCCGVGMTATIRLYLIGLGQQVKTALRLVRASEGGVRPVRAR